MFIPTQINLVNLSYCYRRYFHLFVILVVVVVVVVVVVTAHIQMTLAISCSSLQQNLQTRR